MKAIVLFLLVTVFCHGINGKVTKLLFRRKRDAAGSLDIITNHASPIHADVNGDMVQTKEKLCSLNRRPSKIEPGIVFQVVPPKDTFYEVKSLRKSYPMTTYLDLIRGVSRIVALAVIISSAAVEFYPVVVNMYNTIYDFFYFNKY